jgi:hypothetical protein
MYQCLYNICLTYFHWTSPESICKCSFFFLHLCPSFFLLFFDIFTCQAMSIKSLIFSFYFPVSAFHFWSFIWAFTHLDRLSVYAFVERNVWAQDFQGGGCNSVRCLMLRQDEKNDAKPIMRQQKKYREGNKKTLKKKVRRPSISSCKQSSTSISFFLFLFFIFWSFKTWNMKTRPGSYHTLVESPMRFKSVLRQNTFIY